LPYFGARLNAIEENVHSSYKKDFMNFFKFVFMPEIEWFSMKDM
jgi:hypothetical protein